MKGINVYINKEFYSYVTNVLTFLPINPLDGGYFS